MNTSIFIRTYHKDLEWLRYCLKSIAKYATGFHEVVVAIPVHSAAMIEDIPNIRVEPWNPVHSDGYMDQQACKLAADRVCQGDMILFLDSDSCIFEPITPETFMRDGKPMMIWRDYSVAGEAQCWKGITEAAMKDIVLNEYMARLPIVFLKKHLYELRETWFPATHGISLFDFMRRQPGRHFSEFNLMGAWANKYHPDDYSWVECSKEPLPSVITHWSWGGLTKEIRHKLEDITK